MAFFGDPAYAPPEALYQQDYPEWHDRRQARDLWTLGSLILFLLSKVNLTAQVMLRVPPSHQPGAWGDSYDLVVPTLRNSLHAVLRDESAFKSPVGEELRKVVKELCDPDPRNRGSRRVFNRPQRYSLNRYASIFERLMRRAMI